MAGLPPMRIQAGKEVECGGGGGCGGADTGEGQRELINRAQPGSGFKGGGSRMAQAVRPRQLRR